MTIDEGFDDDDDFQGDDDDFDDEDEYPEDDEPDDEAYADDEYDEGERCDDCGMTINQEACRGCGIIVYCGCDPCDCPPAR